MAHGKLILALGAIAGLIAAAPAAAKDGEGGMMAAPAGGPDMRYCMRVEAFTGSRIEPVKCWTRAQWQAQGVSVDMDWAKNGVRTVG